MLFTHDVNPTEIWNDANTFEGGNLRQFYKNWLSILKINFSCINCNSLQLDLKEFPFHYNEPVYQLSAKENIVYSEVEKLLKEKAIIYST